LTTLLDLPHHDGSARYLEQRVPAVGDHLRVRVSVPGTYEVRSIHVRSVLDGEPSWTTAVRDEGGAAETWWSADLLVGNPVTNYRFLLDRGPDGYAWLNGTGVHRREVSDAFDFRVTVFPRAPEWVQGAVIYQVFPDRFARSGQVELPTPEWAVPARWDEPVVERGPATPLQFFGGDLTGVEEHLDHLVELGATVLYLCPFFPAASNHRYNASTFDMVDPLLGGDDALVSLVAAAHERGLRVLGDLTTNHTGDTHEWFRRAVADPTSVEAGFYLFRDHPTEYECWLGERTLPKLDLRDPELRTRFVEGPTSTVARYLDAPFHLDGWRIDVANMTGRSGAVDVNAEVAATVRATMQETSPDAYLLGEHFHDPSLDLRRDGWHGVMNYMGFLRPLWQWLCDVGSPVPFLGMPVDVASIGGDDAAAMMREASAQVPWAGFVASSTLLGSHDTPRLRTVVGSRERQLVGATLLATYPGVPMLFMGDELGLTGIDGEDSRTPMPWDRLDETDTTALAAYRQLFTLRREEPALQHGGLRWVDARPELLAYLRETDDDRLLVLAVRDGTEHLTIPVTPGSPEPSVLVGAADVSTDVDRVTVQVTGPAAAVVRL
jgi:alpha-glucosidase